MSERPHLHERELSPIQMLAGLTALAWVAYSWDAYMQIGRYGAFLAAVTGFGVVRLAPMCAPEKELPVLYGWEDDVATLSLMRMPIVASVFFGPALRHLAIELFPAYFAGRRAYEVVLFGSVIAGAIMAFSIRARSKNSPGGRP